MGMLEGRSAVVTGGSQGIGAAIAMEFAREGAEVSIVARGAAALDGTAGRIRAETGREVHVFAADLREPGAPAAAVEATLAVFGKLDILVNNAGATKRGDFFSLADEDFVDGFALKFLAAVRATRAAWPRLVETRGNIVNIVGVGARVGAPDFAIGGPVNSACLNFSKAMAERGRIDGVRVNAINPGPVLTPRLERNLDRLRAERGLSREAALDAIRDAFQATRIGEPEDIAGLAAFVASERGSLLNGAAIDMDGGSVKGL